MATSESDRLSAFRHHAALVSAGTSAGPIYDMALRLVERLDLRGSVLDHGAGTGAFAEVLARTRRFDNVRAADLIDFRVDSATSAVDMAPEGTEIEWTFADLNSRLPLADGSFDAVFSLEVIEHLENPRAMIRDLYRLLKPGGVAVVTTPNNASIRSLVALVARGHFVAFGESSYPAHITALLPTDLRRIATETGLVQCQLVYSDHGGVPGLPYVPWQRASSRFRGQLFSDTVALVGIKA